MLVREIMTETVKTVTPMTPLIEVVSLMCLYRYSGLPVAAGRVLLALSASEAAA